MQYQKQKVWMLFSVIIFFIILSFSFALAGNNCTKEEIMKMINSGFTKSQIDEICNQEPHCCCETKLYLYDNGYSYDSSTYEWVKADQCGKSWTTQFGHKKYEQYCTSKYKCGR